jgi:hypothetical protein
MPRHDLLDPVTTLHVEVVADEQMLGRRRPPGEASGHEVRGGSAAWGS